MTDREDDSAPPDEPAEGAETDQPDAEPERPASGADDDGGDERDDRREDRESAPLGGLAERVTGERDDDQHDGLDWLDSSADRPGRESGGGGRPETSTDDTSDERAGREVPDATLRDQHAEGDQPGQSGQSGESGEPDEDLSEAPLDRIASDVRERRQRREREPEADLFEEMDVREIDGEQIWDELLSEEEEVEGASESERAVGAGAEVTEVGTAPGQQRQAHIVPKDEFCGRCPHLGDPPALTCEHDGTDIVEVTDADHFRVRGCPFADRDEDDLAEFD